jgi:glycosyltransferase involved in cell wall biosynthesis
MSPDTPKTVAILLSCDSFESFYGSVLQLDREKYLAKYRNDWSWYYARGLIENGLRPILYIPSVQHEGFHQTEAGVGVRFLRLAGWYRPFAPLRRAMRITRWSLYAQERLNAMAFLTPLNDALATDNAGLLYIQEYWCGRFDHLVHRVNVPVSAVDQGGLSNGVVKWFKRSAMERASALYCQTVDECEQVQRWGGNPTLQPNGGDTSFFSPPPRGSQRQKNIVTVARLTDKQKRTSDLIRAMKLLSQDWSLDIIGTGPDREMLESLASQIGVSSRVKFHGFQSQADIRSFNQRCGVYAMPSSNEGVCLAILEAMSCGAAVAASRIRTFESLITDGVNGMLFSVGDVAGIASAIESAWNHRETLGTAAVVAVSEKFNSKTLYSRLADTMRQSFAPMPQLTT